MTLSDRDLMRAAAAGDADAFQAAVGRYGARIVCFLDRFLGDRARASDLAQEAFLRLYQRVRRSGGEHAGDATSLLFTIAANLGRDELRRRRTRREAPLDGAAAAHAAASPPEAGIEREERERAVRTALARLDPDTRLLLVLRDVQGLSYEEIGAVLAVPLGTVKSRISRARVAFRDEWAAAGGEPTGT